MLYHRYLHAQFKMNTHKKWKAMQWINGENILGKNHEKFHKILNCQQQISHYHLTIHNVQQPLKH